MVNNIPVNGWPQLKDLEAVQPILNRLDKIEAWKRTVKEETFTGEEITIPNALSLPARSLKTAINAIQDLHGYDKPWAGGAGKNKLPMIASNIKSLNTDGTWSGNVYTRNGGTIEMLVDDADNVIGFKANGTFTDVSIFNLAYYTANTGDILNGCPSGGGESTYKIYARGGSTGDTGSGATVAASDVGVERIYAIAIFAGAVSNKMFYPMLRLSTESDASFAPYSNICPISGRTAVTITDYDSESNTASVTIQLEQTVYGGNLNVTTGVLTITHANIASYNGETIGEPWISSLDEYTQGGTPTTGAQVVYSLTTPQTIQLTPTDLQMLKGYNRLSCDGGGDITVQAYTGAAWGGDEA